MTALTAAEARELLNYEPDTGVITWRKSVPRRKAGSIAGATAADGYRRICIRRKQYAAHRVIWLMTYGEWPASQVDHINRNRADNRISNLRAADGWQNQANTAATTKAAGVQWDRRHGKWHVAIRHKGARFFLGSFTDRALAERAYDDKARELRGDFYSVRAAQSNPPTDEVG